MFDEEDANIVEFDKTELLSILQENGYHSVEQSDTEDEIRERLPDNKRFFHVYDHPWRSDKVAIIYHYVLVFKHYSVLIPIFLIVKIAATTCIGPCFRAYSTCQEATRTNL